MDPESLMHMAIEKATEGIATGQSPFGCAVSSHGELLACEHNNVVATTDSTAHAEIVALRAACRTTNHFLLEGAIVATTCEPCPMCMAALHWARIETVYFGATIADAAAAGFNELHIPANQLLKLGESQVRLVPQILADECRELFSLWKQRDDRVVY